MRYLHAMVRVRDVDASLRFFRDGLGLVEPAAGFLSAMGREGRSGGDVELTT